MSLPSHLANFSNVNKSSILTNNRTFLLILLKVPVCLTKPAKFHHVRLKISFCQGNVQQKLPKLQCKDKGTVLQNKLLSSKELQYARLLPNRQRRICKDWTHNLCFERKIKINITHVHLTIKIFTVERNSVYILI